MDNHILRKYRRRLSMEMETNEVEKETDDYLDANGAVAVRSSIAGTPLTPSLSLRKEYAVGKCTVIQKYYVYAGSNEVTVLVSFSGDEQRTKQLKSDIEEIVDAVPGVSR